MELQPLTRNYFSSSSYNEKICRTICFIFTTVLVLIIYFFWYPLRSAELTYPIVAWSIANPYLAVIFRIITTLGSEGFFLVVLSVVYWSLNKTFAFWGLIVMSLSVLITSEIPKDITRLSRPSIRGVAVATYTFPSGHTSGAVSVWGYAAIMLKRRWFWILALIVMASVGLSRVTLGYHFPGDVLGGFVTGILFLAASFWLATSKVHRHLSVKFPFRLRMLLLVTLPFALSFLPVKRLPGLLGYFTGAAVGYLLEGRNLRFSVSGDIWQHIMRAVIGLPLLIVVVIDLSLILPVDMPWLIFIQYSLATFWVTYLAPLVFVRLGLMKPRAISRK